MSVRPLLTVAVVAVVACADGMESDSRGTGMTLGDPTSEGSTGNSDPTSEISAANASVTDGTGGTGNQNASTGENTTGCTRNDQCSDLDANLCTVPRCGVDGSCSEQAVTCMGSDDPCQSNACDPLTGMCESMPLDGIPCDDDEPCTPTDMCQAGTCVGSGDLCADPPDHPVISEVLYDDPDADNDVWIELWAPPGTDLQGYTLEFVNGNGGAVGDSLALSGNVGPDGLLLIVDPSATQQGLISRADITDTIADLQNGPDNVRIMQGTTVIDALGFGTFTNDDTFAGEGSPAPDASGTQSLARLATFVDTDDNSADFSLSDSPTPGEPNQ